MSDLNQAICRSVEWLSASQEPDGSWEGDYGGPLFLLPLYIATHAVIGESITPEQRSEMARYIRGQQNLDGGFGLHVEGESTVYGTSANYVALRILGFPPEEPELRAARQWLIERGGPLGSASGGKFFLALLDLYPYEEIAPTQPELWLLPQSAPMHPSKLWCHCRMVYLPMSYLFASRAKWNGKDLLDVDIKQQLRDELYQRPYEDVDFKAAFGRVVKEDNLQPQTLLSRGTARLLRVLEKGFSRGTRRAALDYVLHQIDREDHNTDYICIGPINKLLNTLVWYFEDPESIELKEHKKRLSDYLYQGADGLKMQGYNSSRLWDAAFAVQALNAVPPNSASASAVQQVLQNAHQFIDEQQLRDDVWDRESAFRHKSKGGWPFSDRAHGWPISDCTAEGLKATLCVQERVATPLEQPRFVEAVELLLSLQNTDGGWATYELQRGGAWLEWLNPSDCFREIMVDYSYVECTSACLSALVDFRSQYPDILRLEIGRAIVRGRDFILEQQRADGSFEGSWGVCFTYGTYFGVNGLIAADLSQEHPALVRARQFLLSRQNDDGGWGESVSNCQSRRYEEGIKSQVVMTAWAALSLMSLGQHKGPAVRGAIDFMCSRQRSDGSFPAEKLAGVFNKTCAIHYDNYLKIFPLWACARYSALSLKGLKPAALASAAE